MAAADERQPDLNFESEAPSGVDQWRSSVHPVTAVEPLELNFASGGRGIDAWRGAQAEKREDLARKVGLPIGENVRVLLKSDLELTGRLILDSETGDFQVGGTPFAKFEMVSCLRLA